MNINKIYQIVKNINFTTDKKDKTPYYQSNISNYNLIYLYTDLSEQDEKALTGKINTYLNKEYFFNNEKVSKLFAFYLSNLNEGQLELFEEIKIEINIKIFLTKFFENLLVNSKKIISKEYNYENFITEGQNNISDFYKYLEGVNINKYLTYSEDLKIPNFFQVHNILANMKISQNQAFDINNKFTRVLYDFNYELYEDFKKNNFKKVYESEINYTLLKEGYYINFENILLLNFGCLDIGRIKYKPSQDQKTNFFYLPSGQRLDISLKTVPFVKKEAKFLENFSPEIIDDWFEIINNYLNIRKRNESLNFIFSSIAFNEYILIFNISLFESIFLNKEDNKEDLFVKRLSVFMSLGKKENYTKNKSKLKKIYKYRSMAVHGNISFNNEENFEIKNFIEQDLHFFIRSIESFLVDLIINKQPIKRKNWLKEIDFMASSFELDKNIDIIEFIKQFPHLKKLLKSDI